MSMIRDLGILRYAGYRNSRRVPRSTDRIFSIICLPRPRAKPEYPLRDWARRSSLRLLPHLLLMAITPSPAQSEGCQPDQQSHAENAKQG